MSTVTSGKLDVTKTHFLPQKYFFQKKYKIPKVYSYNDSLKENGVSVLFYHQ